MAIKKILQPALSFFVFFLAIWVVHNELSTLNYHKVLNTLETFPLYPLSGAFLATALSYSVLIFAEKAALVYVKRTDIPSGTAAIASFVSHVLSHNVGFSFLSGVPVRLRFYSKYTFSAMELAKVLVFNEATFWLGLFAMGGISFLFFPVRIPFTNLPPQTLGGLFLSFVLLYLLATKLPPQKLKLWKWTFRMPTFQLAVVQIFVSFIDWFATAWSLYLLLPDALNITLFQFCALFLAAQVAGILSQIPGGLGVFEGALLFALGEPGLNSSIVAALLLFRVIYYVLPLGFAVGAIAVWPTSES